MTWVSLLTKTLRARSICPSGFAKNVLSEFPQDGYENMKLGESPEGYRHPSATSAAWQDENPLAIKSYMTGNHLGSVYIRIGFRKNKVAVEMSKTANYFLEEYCGSAIGEII